MCVLASAVDIFILTHREAVISKQLVTASLRYIPLSCFTVVAICSKNSKI